MNFLAHAYLSFGNHEILVGNMMGDFVKGKQKDLFADGITKGIELHRFIDSFTDLHPVVREAGKIFRPLVGRYAGAFTDIAFDYLLANDPKEKTQKQWQTFAQDTYQVLARYRPYFPEKFSAVFSHMQQYDWLYHYRFFTEIGNSFISIIRRAKYLSVDAARVFAAFEANLTVLQESYDIFFPQLKKEVQNRISAFS